MQSKYTVIYTCIILLIIRLFERNKNSERIYQPTIIKKSKKLSNIVLIRDMDLTTTNQYQNHKKICIQRS